MTFACHLMLLLFPTACIKHRAVPQSFDQCFSKTTVIAAGHVRQAEQATQRMSSLLKRGACSAESLKHLDSYKHRTVS